MRPTHVVASRAFLLVGLALVATGGWLASSCTRRAPSPGPAAAASAAPVPELASVLIERVPHIRQKPDFCGEAAAASYLGTLGLPVDQDDVFDVSGLDPARGMGVTTRELRTALERLGVRPGPVWHSVSAAKASSELGALFAELHADLARGVPSIVCMHYDESPTTTEHFRLILGYDAQKDEVVYHEPAEDGGGYRRMSRQRFLSLWPLPYEKERWTVIRLRLEPGRLEKPEPRSGTVPRFRPADYAQHVMKLRDKLPAGFSVVVEPPFVVVGDAGASEVRRSSESTVRWTVRMLEKDFFARSPQRILTVWLFKGAESYDKHNLELFGEAPSTPYGYYSREHRALVMNIATGGGTLVHEIVHPYMEANVPEAPAWLNEGLGSLFEQSAERDGHIVGLTNWRLAGLQRAIRQKRVPSFKTLLSTSSSEFYGDDSGVHYAEARYLLYYLQERELLRPFFRAYLARRAEDPTGYATLVRTLGAPDMNVFQRDWERYVLALRFP